MEKLVEYIDDKSMGYKVVNFEPPEYDEIKDCGNYDFSKEGTIRKSHKLYGFHYGNLIKSDFTMQKKERMEDGSHFVEFISGIGNCKVQVLYDNN